MAPQVYGDGVMDEAPLLIITNYHVTFLEAQPVMCLTSACGHRQQSGGTRQSPPARVWWLHALQQAQELQLLKASLRRVAVPHTLAGYALPQQLNSAGETESTPPSDLARGRALLRKLLSQ